MFFGVALIAYLIDRLFGEFRFIRHPVVLMGDYIGWFEKRFYTDSVARGGILAATLISLVGAAAYLLSLIDNVVILGVIASTAIAGKMLYESVYEVAIRPESIRYLVSRDTEGLSPSDIHKAAIETYAENLSDGVIAPLFYLALFGLPGAFVYKAVNTLDSMVGYRNERYEKFGKLSARLDDVLNYIPSRLTALIILVVRGNISLLRKTWRYGALHASPNAGYPISAMALSLGLSLGGPTRYFGHMKEKAYFGDGRRDITVGDLLEALRSRGRIDILSITLLLAGVLL